MSSNGDAQQAVQYLTLAVQLFSKAQVPAEHIDLTRIEALLERFATVSQERRPALRRARRCPCLSHSVTSLTSQAISVS